MWYITAILSKKKHGLIYDSTEMSFKNTLSEKTQTQVTTHHRTACVEYPECTNRKRQEVDQWLPLGDDEIF